MQAIIDREVNEMEAAGVIEASHSAWSSPVVIMKKKDGKHRFCIDFRRVNEVTEKDAYPLPQVTATLDKLRGARYLTTLDLKKGYWQVPLDAASRPITAFTIPGRGLFQFTVMPFGLHSAPATFQRLLDTILGPALEPHVFVYLDDIIILSRTFDEHLELLAEVFRRLRDARLRFNPEKCRFCIGQLKYLGHVIDRDGIRTDPEKVSAVNNWPEPTTVKQVRQFLGMASWYRRFIASFSLIAAPLIRLTKKNARWSWGPAEGDAFRALKRTLVSAPVLACPDFSRPFVLQTDASTDGLGAVLTQNYEEGERVIAYASRTLNGAERNYSATELECLAVVWGIRRMKGYLEGYRFTVITDHQSLKWLQRLEAPTGRLA
ncbi:reverse ribonuclease integrase, partial [Lasius niger]